MSPELSIHFHLSLSPKHHQQYQSFITCPYFGYGSSLLPRVTSSQHAVLSLEPFCTYPPYHFTRSPSNQHQRFQVLLRWPPILSQRYRLTSSHQTMLILLGVAYQPTPADPLTNATQCFLDAQLMSSIAVNSIRVYHVNSRVNHDECMQIFETAGIYLWVDLSTFNNAIPQVDPHWTQEQFLEYVNVVRAFHKYNNLAGFWIGNQDISTKQGSLAAPYIKAAAADIRTYMQVAGHRQIPIGYSAADVTELRPMLQNYLACDTRREQAIDFFGMNNFQWCGLATYAGYSGYKTLQEQAKDYPVPIFFSETGCITQRPRKFEDQAAIFGNMSGVWSGAIIYEWAQKMNGK